MQLSTLFFLSAVKNSVFPADIEVIIKKALKALDRNSEEKLNMTMKDVEQYFKDNFRIDVYQAHKQNILGNATICTGLHSENCENYYNKNREEMVCNIQIYKKSYDQEYLTKLIEALGLNPSYYEDNDGSN